MTGTSHLVRYNLRLSICAAAMLALAACDENGEFAFPGGDSDAGASNQNTSVAVQTTTGEQDVERPDVFEVTDRGLWDGRPSLGGIWVAHPDATDPERVIIRNSENGRSVVGALFRRERENPGPLLQVSSDAAEELGILAGAPTELRVVALRREEIEVDVPIENPVTADLASPVTVEETPLDPIAGAAAAIDAAEDAAPAVEVSLPPAEASAAAEAVAAPAVAVAAAGDAASITGPSVQIGVFSVEPNANEAAETLRNAGIPTSVIAQQAGGRTVWRVVSGPMADSDARDTALTQIKELGYVDAFALDS